MQNAQRRRVCAAVTACVFFCTQPVWAGAEPFRSLQISGEFGEVRESRQGESGKVIIHIQDSHSNFEAQKNIARIIQELAKSGVSLVGLEGASEPPRIEEFRNYPSPRPKEEVGLELVKRGDFTGGELGGILSVPEVRLFGVEDKRLYLRNYRAFQSVAEIRKEILDALSDLEKTIGNFKAVLLSSESRKLERFLMDYRRGVRKAWDYFKRLEKEAAAEKLPLERYPAFFEYLNWFHEQEKMNAARPDPARLKASLEKFGKIDYEGLLRESREIEKAVRLGLCENETQRELIRLSFRQELLADLVSLEAVREQYGDYRKNESGFSAGSFLGFFERTASDYGIRYSVSPKIRELDRLLPKVKAFYETAQKRDDAMLHRAVRQLEKTGEKAAVLVTGGYHTPGLVQRMKDQGISYFVVTPKMTSSASDIPYEDLMTGKIRPVEFFRSQLQRVLRSEPGLLEETGLLHRMGFQSPDEYWRYFTGQVLSRFAAVDLLDRLQKQLEDRASPITDQEVQQILQQTLQRFSEYLEQHRYQAEIQGSATTAHLLAQKAGRIDRLVLRERNQLISVIQSGIQKISLATPDTLPAVLLGIRSDLEQALSSYLDSLTRAKAEAFGRSEVRGNFLRHDHVSKPGHTDGVLQALNAQNHELYEWFERFMARNGFKGVYIAPEISRDLFQSAVKSSFTHPRVMTRSVDGQTFNVEYAPPPYEIHSHILRPEHTQGLLDSLDARELRSLEDHLRARHFTRVYIDPGVSLVVLEAWIKSGFTDPQILPRRVDGTTVNIELSSVRAQNINEGVRERLKAALEKTRDRGFIGVMEVSIEVPLFDLQGRKMKRVGPGGGGLGLFMEEQPSLVAGEGVSVGVASPLFSADLEAYMQANHAGLPKGAWLDQFLKDFGAEFLMDLELPVGGGTVPFKVLALEREGVSHFLIYHEEGEFFHTLYDRPYPNTFGAYLEAYFLPLAAVEIPRQLGIQFETYHFHDWQTASGLVILTERYRDQTWPLGHPPGPTQNIHSLYKGDFPNFMKPDDPLRKYLIQRRALSLDAPESIDIFSLTHLDAYRGYPVASLRDRKNNDGLEFFGAHSLLKSLIRSRKVVFVSQGHRREALTDRGQGFDGILRTLPEGVLEAVYNGIRAAKHRPENLKALRQDGFIPVDPSRTLPMMTPGERAEWKRLNKAALQRRLGLEPNEKHMVVGIVTRIVSQKGLNLLMTVMPSGKTLLEELLGLEDPKTGAKIQIAVLGTAGDQPGKIQARFLREFLKQHPGYQGRFVFVEKFDPLLKDQMSAGKDVFFMPSIDEYGGLANLESALKLALVLAPSRGGLNDFKQAGGTPLPLIDGFEINGSHEAATPSDPDYSEYQAQRQKSGAQTLAILLDLMVLYNDYLEKSKLGPVTEHRYLDYLTSVANFNPDWGDRPKEYVRIYREALAAVRSEVRTQRAVEGIPAKRPATAAEAVRKWKQYVREAPVSNSPLLTKAPLSFFVTTTPEKGWQNPVTHDSGFYAKVLPPFTLRDGRNIVPIVGDFYEVKTIEEVVDPAAKELVDAAGGLTRSARMFEEREKEWRKHSPESRPAGSPSSGPSEIKEYLRGLETLDGMMNQIKNLPSQQAARGQAAPIKKIAASTLKSLLYILKEHDDPVFREFLKERHISFEELISLPDGVLEIFVPGRIFYQGDQVRWKDYWEKNKGRNEVQDVGRKRWAHHEKSLLYKKWELENRGGWKDSTEWRLFKLDEIEDEKYAFEAVSMFEAYETLEDYLGPALRFESVEKVTIPGLKVRAVIHPLDDREIRERFGLERVYDSLGKPLTVEAHTYKDVVGRLAFLYGPGGFAEAQSEEGVRQAIDTPEDFLSALLKGDALSLVSGRLDIKSAGTIQPKIHRLKASGIKPGRKAERVVKKMPEGLVVEKWPDQPWESSISLGVRRVIGQSAKIESELILEHDGKSEVISWEDFLKRPGMVFDSEYQPGFPSPSGTEVAPFSEEAVKAERNFQALSGMSPYHTFSRFSFGGQKSDKKELQASLRFTRADGEGSLRLHEAFEEFRRDPERSLIGKWIREGRTQKVLEDFFLNLGKNQFALLAAGKIWIRLGAQLQHMSSPAQVSPLSETYLFFLKNTDIVEGRQADLGDFLELKTNPEDRSLDDRDVHESIAILIHLVGQLLHDLEAKGVTRDSEELRKHLLGRFVEGFTGQAVSEKDLPDPPTLDRVRYVREIHEERMSYYGTNTLIHPYLAFRREPLKETEKLEPLLKKLSGIFDPVLKEFWPVEFINYDAGADTTFTDRLSPFDPPNVFYGSAKGLRKTPEEYFHFISRMRHGTRRPGTAMTEEGTSVLGAIQSAHGQVRKKEADFRNALEKARDSLESSVREKYKDFFELILAVHQAFQSQGNRVFLKDRELSLSEALNQINQIRQALGDFSANAAVRSEVRFTAEKVVLVDREVMQSSGIRAVDQWMKLVYGPDYDHYKAKVEEEIEKRMEEERAAVGGKLGLRVIPFRRGSADEDFSQALRRSGVTNPEQVFVVDRALEQEGGLQDMGARVAEIEGSGVPRNQIGFLRLSRSLPDLKGKRVGDRIEVPLSFSDVIFDLLKRTSRGEVRRPSFYSTRPILLTPDYYSALSELGKIQERLAASA
ncbi:MAG: glycogen/starch synthase [Candidatus Omnitrophica bacterium]|nr:glycogen/starch synthase [Candidatus Omnitrophota bacterium]